MLLFGIILVIFTVTSCQPLPSLFSNFEMDSIIPAEIKRTLEYNKPDSMPIISRSMLDANKGHLSRASISRAMSNMRDVVAQISNSVAEKRNANLLGYDYFLPQQQQNTPFNLFTSLQQMPYKRAFEQPLLF